MNKNPKQAFYSYFIAVIFSFFSFLSLKAQTETLSTGSFIINMGATNPNTVANGLKPYGLVYDLMRNHNVPIKWVISQTKVKDGVDFTYDGVQYKGGTFIIPAEFRTAAVNARITFWTGVGVGVVGVTTISPLTVDVTQTLKAIPKWTLDSQNGAKAEAYLIAAGITNTAFPGAYNWKTPATLDCCDDFFVMPHADPVWATHNRLLSWNLDCKGSIWAACHATSALENMVNPANRAIQTNFLTQKVAGLAGTSGNYAQSNSLILWGSHGGGSVPYIHQYPNDIVAQYLGPTDAAHQNGSEQIDVPNQAPTGGWNPGAKIIAYDPTQANVTNPIRPDKTNAAAVIVYGRGFDDPARGFVMYEPAHSHAGTAGPNVAAQRVFLNFSFFQVQPKAPQLAVTGVIGGQQITGGTSINGLNVVATSALTGITFTYLWSSTCGGTFSSATAATTNFTAPVVGAVTNCIITCKVTDNCGRVSFQSIPVVILPPPAAPTVVNDVANLAGSCSPGTSVTLNVLTNDVPNASSITFTSLNQGAAVPANAGIWNSDGIGNVTFTPNANFNGAATITYTVTNTQGQTNTATITVNVGTTDVNGCSSNQVYAPSDIGLITLATGSFVSQNGTTGGVDELSLDDFENIYSDNNVDYVNFGTNVGNNLVMAIGSTSALRAKDTINIYWSKSNTSSASMSVQIGQSGTGPWTNAQTFTNAIVATGTAANTISKFIIPGGVSGITHIRINAGTLPATNSGTNVWVDAVEYQYLTCITRAPQLTNDATTVLEDAPAIINVLANDNDAQGLPLTVSRIVTQPANGKVSINLDGTVTYITTTDNATATSFVYEACNSQGYCATATVSIIVSADGCAAGSFRANPPAGAQTRFFQSGFAGTNAATANPTATNFRDSKLNQASGGNDNYGGDNKIEVGFQFSGTKAVRPVFQFNISEIPTNAVVQNATFSAYRAGGNNDLQTVNLHGLSADFVENQVTWLIRSTGNNWGTAGGAFGSLISSANLNGVKTRFNWDVKDLVTTWVATPANNFGLLLKTGETLNKSHQFNTKEIGTIGLRPGLSVTYVVPEPCDVITNRAPLAQPDYATTVNGQSVIISPLPNDADVDAGNTFTITAVSGITAGSATFTGTTITYTANISATVPRTERLTYTITDNNGATDQAYVYITVTNAPPTANRDDVTTNSGTLLNIAAITNDNDPEGGSLTAPVITAAPKNGTATVVGNTIDYTPGPGFTGIDTLVYQLCETAAGSCSPSVFCDTALVVINVINQKPIAVNDAKTILPCFSNTITLISNDTDAEGNVLSVSNLTALVPATTNNLVNNGDGTVTFIPGTGITGVFTFTYTVTDNGISPETSLLPATVTITVQNPVNGSPVAVNDAENINIDQKLYYSVRDNDSDPNNNSLTIPTITVPPIHGTAIVNLINGQVEYTPNPGYFGTDVLTYSICDIILLDVNTCTSGIGLCATATLTITIDAPTNSTNAYNDEHSTWQDVNVSSNVLTNDNDLEADAQVIGGFFDKDANTYKTSGTFNVYAEDGLTLAGQITIMSNGDFTFDPLPTFSGVVSVPYFISDVVSPSGSKPTVTDTALLKITVSPLPALSNSIIANNDEYILPLNSPNLNSSVTAFNDFDPQGNPFTVTAFTYDNDGDPGTPNVAGTVGAAAITIGGISSTGLPTANAGTLILNADGTFTFNAENDFTGSIDVVYTITDALGASTTAILHIDILPDVNGAANDAPFAADDFKYTNVNTPVSGNALSNDTDPNAGNTIATTPQTTNVPGVGTLVLAANGTYTFTPAAGYTGPATFPYTVCDNQAPALCTDATLHFLVGIDNSTDAINDETSTWQDVNVSGGVVANDFDAESNTQTFGSFLAQGAVPGAPITTGATLSGVDKTGSPVVNAGVLTFAADGTYTFDPDPAFTGTVSVPYRLCDNGNLSKCDTAYLLITVDPLPTTGLNSAIANNDENVSYGSPVGGSLFVNDRDPQADAFTVTSFVGGTVGTSGIVAGIDLNGNVVANAGTLTINANGSYTYTPATGFVGSINVPYTITDANGATSTAILHIDVLKDPNGPRNDPPFAGDDFGYTTINKPELGNFVSNDNDPNGDPVSYMGVTIVPAGPATPIGGPVATAQGGTVQFYANGTYLYTPPAGYVGPDRLPYTICDVTVVLPQPLCADATIHLLVGPGINIAGKVWDDADGNVIDAGAGEPDTNIGGTLYVNLVDALGNVVATTAVLPDGSYSFANITPGVSYTVQLSTNQGVVGNPAPPVALPGGWINTGETRNGTIDGGTIGVIDTRNYGYTNTINFDFGIEQLPNSDPHTTNILQPTVNQFITLSGAANPPVLSGIDPEDCSGGCTLANKSVIIDAVPANSELYYNGILVTNGQQINNFDPSLLQIKITTATLGFTSTSFQYSYVDMAGKKDPTPATYTLNWLTPLPITLESFTAAAQTNNVLLKWVVSDEINVAKYEIEFSTNAVNFVSIGSHAAVNLRTYNMLHTNPVFGFNFYRLKIVDIDGKVNYSEIRKVNYGKGGRINIYPNPSSDFVNITFTNLMVNKPGVINLIAIDGKLILRKSFNALSQTETINLKGFAGGKYILQIVTNSELITKSIEIIR